jgi:type I restriction enzyme, S subunit
VSWTRTRLRYVADLNPPIRPDLLQEPSQEVSFLPMEAVGEDGSLDLGRTRSVADVRNGYSYFEDGDVAIAKVTPCFENGKGALMRGLAGGAGFGTTELTVLRPRPGVDPRFLRYFLASAQFMADAAGAMTGAGGLKRVPDWFVRDYPARWPTHGIQTRIAKFLDEQTARIDALIAEKEKLVDSLKDIEEVTAFDLITRGPDANVRRTSYAEPWLPEVPAHWKLLKLRYLAAIGNGSTPKRDNDSYWSGGHIPWLNSGAVNNARIQEASDFVTDAAKRECHLPMVRAGSTVVALTGQGKTRGSAAYTELEATINQHLAYVSPFDVSLTDEYLWVAMNGFYSVLRYISDGEGSTKGALTCEQLNRFRLPLPSREEQGRIIETYKRRTKAIEELVQHAREHIERLREYRSSLISAAVTGQVDFNTAEAA